MNRTYLAVLTSITLIGFLTVITILLARGYLPDFQNKTISPTGILVSTSDPNAARVYINNKLEGATNANVNLVPGSYDIRIEKEGYSSWSKKTIIRKEEVIKTNAFLFPKAPDLRPLTLTASLNPTLAPDGHQIVYGVASVSAEKNGVWILDTDGGHLSISGFNTKQIYRESDSLKLSGYHFLWSPDSDQLLVFKTTKNISIGAGPYQSVLSGIKYASNFYILDVTQLNSSPQIVPAKSVELLLGSWINQLEEKNTLMLSKLDPKIAVFFKNSAFDFSLSQDEKKFLYTATSSAILPIVLQSPLPGSNSTPESRNLQTGKVYLYDMTEDRNYFIVDSNIYKNTKISLFPTTPHLLLFAEKEISVVEYDGTNKAVLYTGPYNQDFYAIWPNGSKIVILTTLNNPSEGENLYTINLR